MSWAAALKEYVNENDTKELYKSEKTIENEYFKELMGYNNIKNNYRIPQFFFKVIISFNIILLKFSNNIILF